MKLRTPIMAIAMALLFCLISCGKQQNEPPMITDSVVQNRTSGSCDFDYPSNCLTYRYSSQEVIIMGCIHHIPYMEVLVCGNDV